MSSSCSNASRSDFSRASKKRRTKALFCSAARMMSSGIFCRTYRVCSQVTASAGFERATSQAKGAGINPAPLSSRG
jgi:hypothetical protein